MGRALQSSTAATTTTRVGNGDMRVNYLNEVSNNFSDLENLEKINKFKAELDSYQKMLIGKLNNNNNINDQASGNRSVDLIGQLKSNEKPQSNFKSIVNNQVCLLTKKKIK